MNTQNSITGYDSILAPIKEEMNQVEQVLLKNLETNIPLLNSVSQYILKSGGKRFRPALLLLSAAVAGEINDKTYAAAAVIEYIHTATLLHDDVVDNADLRRSKKAARSIWGNEASVLVGDYLFTISFKYLAEFEDVELIRLLSLATTDMAKGEIIQLQRNNDHATEEEYLSIIQFKTASLIATAMSLGAKIAGADKEMQSSLYNCGMNLGMAFQMIDDALDYNLEKAKTGKSIGTDLKERKITLPLSHLIYNSNQEDKETVVKILDKEIIEDSDVTNIHGLMLKYESIQYTQQRAMKYTQNAKDSISALPESAYRKSIEQLADFIISRNV